jgi:hypothetical protein
VNLWSCQCGNEQAMGTMAPAPCDGCRTCKTNLTDHQPTIPHEYMNELNTTDEGPAVVQRCVLCKQCRHDIEARP